MAFINILACMITSYCNILCVSSFTEHSDPSFAVPIPYVTECHSMHGYSSVTLSECVLFKDYKGFSLQVGLDLVMWSKNVVSTFYTLYLSNFKTFGPL